MGKVWDGMGIMLTIGIDKPMEINKRFVKKCRLIRKRERERDLFSFHNTLLCYLNILLRRNIKLNLLFLKHKK